MQWADMDSDEEAISQNGVKKMELNPREHGKVKKKLWREQEESLESSKLEKLW